jgi:hypothetical protein
MRRKANIKRMAEGGEAKKGLNDTKFGLGLLSPAYAISQMASGDAGIGDFGVMGMMDRFSGKSDGTQLSEDEKVRVRAMLAAQGTPPPPGMKKGGMVKKMAKGGMVRGDGCAMRGKTKGRFV